jgi:hypothetical protein
MSATIVCLLGLPVLAHAGYTPPALAPGDTYQLVFVTSGSIQATSGDIATYDSFVNAQAANDLSLPATTWTALISTAGYTLKGALPTFVPGVSANSNAPACTGTCEIFLVNGTEVAPTQADLFGNSQAMDADENGNPVSGYVWTGSTGTGTVDTPNGAGSTSGQVGIGSATRTGTGVWSAYPYVGVSTKSLPVYAISGQLTVPGVPTPEPMSGSLLLAGGVATGLVRRLRRGRRPTA